MKFDVIFLGGGLGSTYGLYNFIKKISTKKKLKICVIDKQISNLPGGVAYGNKKQNLGFFNNPCRLSPKDFVSWFFKNRSKLIEYTIKLNKVSFNEWLSKNKKTIMNSKNNSDLSEIYLPRIFCNFWLEDLLLKTLKKINKNNWEINYLEGFIENIERKNNYYEVSLKKKPYHFSYNLNQNSFLNKISFVKNKIPSNTSKLKTKHMFASLGIPEPENFVSKKISKDKFYIHDLYVSGGSTKLVNLIEKKNKKKVSIHFLGSKAGFLEALPELYFLSKRKKIKIFSTSNNAETLNPAILSKKSNSYKLKYFSKRKLQKIKNSNDLIENLILEFESAYKNKFNKYDAWTKILKDDILSKVLLNFNKEDQKNYNDYFFQKIRNITRFTFPMTVKYKIMMEKIGIIKMIKSTIKKVTKQKDQFLVKTYSGKLIKSDILVCVFGPQSISKLLINDKLFKSLSNLKIKYDNTGILVNNKFQSVNHKNLYFVGFHASGYNPDRKTIIKAIVKNSKIASINLKNSILAN